MTGEALKHPQQHSRPTHLRASLLCWLALFMLPTLPMHAQSEDNTGHATRTSSTTPALVTVNRPQERKMQFDQALAQLRQNQLNAAEASFSAIIRQDPQHTEALLALAAIAQHQTDSETARHFRQRALVADPTHPGAQAGVLDDLAGTHGTEVESRLRMLQSAHPGSAAVNFVLGNLFAGEKRWHEAQQAYFSAVSLDPGNPDYLYNLAVSLDHLRQIAPASRHYRLALSAREKRAASFDEVGARQRLQQLSP
jgi:Tfp pilus assembly protein PilF